MNNPEITTLPCIREEGEEGHYLQITEWINGDGWDIILRNTEGTQCFSLHMEEMDKIKYLIAKLEYERE